MSRIESKFKIQISTNDRLNQLDDIIIIAAVNKLDLALSGRLPFASKCCTAGAIDKLDFTLSSGRIASLVTISVVSIQLDSIIVLDSVLVISFLTITLLVECTMSSIPFTAFSAKSVHQVIRMQQCKQQEEGQLSGASSSLVLTEEPGKKPKSKCSTTSSGIVSCSSQIGPPPPLNRSLVASVAVCKAYMLCVTSVATTRNYSLNTHTQYAADWPVDTVVFSAVHATNDHNILIAPD